LRKVTLAQIHRTIVHAQGFSGRFRRAGVTEVEAAIRRLTAVQLDSISAVDRAPYWVRHAESAQPG
jgi:uncharacterized protein YcaQ